ncbi:MAG: hypothetical protein ABIN58_09475 [candidate division WOR-3 bacterium]
MDKEPQPIPEPDGPAYEVQDLAFQATLKFLFGLLGAVFFSLLLMWGFYAWLLPRPAQAELVKPPLETVRRLPPEPTLQGTPAQDIETYLAQQKARLEQYGWVDQNAGTVHIPIERAIEITAERGLPARSAVSPQRSAIREGRDAQATRSPAQEETQHAPRNKPQEEKP